MATLKLKVGTSSAGVPMLVKVLVFVAAIAVVAVGYFAVFYTEISSQIELKSGDLDEQQGKLSEAEAAQRAYNKDLTEKARLESLLRKLKKALPDDAEMPTFLSTLQTVATTSGVTLLGWSPGQESKEEFYAKLPMQLRLEGKFHQIARFFHGIGQVDRIINMENIAVRAKTVDTSKALLEEKETRVQVECLATAFRLLAKGEVGRKRRPPPSAEGSPPAASATPPSQPQARESEAKE